LEVSVQEWDRRPLESGVVREKTAGVLGDIGVK
jgi:hypothetical protein